METRIEPIDRHVFKEGESFFLDTSVWLSIYGPNAAPGSRKTRLYSEALKNILSARGHIFINLTIISEFANTCARIEFKLRRKELGFRDNDFKKFRNSKHFKPCSATIAGDLRAILKQSEL